MTQLPDRPSEPAIADGRTVSIEWAVWISGMDNVMPALDRRDAHERAQNANESAVWIEANCAPLDFRPVVWAMPVQYGADSPAGETVPFPTEWNAEHVEDEWKRWAE